MGSGNFGVQFEKLKKCVEESDSDRRLHWHLNGDDWGKTQASRFGKMQRKDVYSDWRGNILERDTAFGDAHENYAVKPNLEVKDSVRDGLRNVSKSGKRKFHVDNN